MLLLQLLHQVQQYGRIDTTTQGDDDTIKRGMSLKLLPQPVDIERLHPHLDYSSKLPKDINR